jgi:hypothetical protein
LLPSHSHNTRSLRLNFPNIRLDIERKFVIFQSVKIFNEVPGYLIEPASSLTLKKQFKEFAIEKYVLCCVLYALFFFF